MADKVAALRRCALFSGLGEAELREVGGIARAFTVRKGETIFAEGEEAEGFFVIASGRVKIFKLAPDGREQILHLFSAGDIFAEAAVFDGGRYPAYAQTLAQSEILLIPKRDFQRLVETKPRLALNMIATLSRLLKQFAALVEELSLREVSARLANYLLGLKPVKGSARGQTVVELDMTKSLLAARLGTISETLSRTFAKLGEAGLIEMRGKRVAILDAEGLEDFAQGE
jgi:CRP/FNR family transcriptional regulator